MQPLREDSPLQTDPPDLPLNLTWIRIREDIAWNQPGARNLGAVYAKSDKILITDLDHEFPEATLRALERRGHRVRFGETWSGGRLTACALEETPEGTVLKAGANPRGMQTYAVGR